MTAISYALNRSLKTDDFLYLFIILKYLINLVKLIVVNGI